MLIGAHVSSSAPLATADEIGAEAVQFFLGNPQSWKPPAPRDDADELRSATVPIYVHANYLINVATDNNRVRIPSRKNLAAVAAGAAEIGAAGVVVHGGHVSDDEDISVGFERWRKALDVVETDIPILIENTAGGGNAVARDLSNYGPLWDELTAGDRDYNIGVVLDTCHAWAAGQDLESAVETLVAATGKVDLVHCNDSRDPFDSRRDRHANLGAGEIPPELLVGVVQAAGAPVIIETPHEAGGHAADIAWLNDRL
ncbi:MAG: deoxyribonuclease IV [Acidimicrobiia bacterium]|nr:deoxyribonuclease IV [Acidimicrobiia bacterium]NNC75053.1 deoxyribonuclease IV [Acidimicrobiia bacterium]